jgi:hypothetical protein
MPQPDPVRLRLAESALVECDRLGLKIVARYGVAFGERVVDGVIQPLPADWKRIIGRLSAEIVAVLGRRESFLCSVERAGSCRVYRPQFASRAAHAEPRSGPCKVYRPDWRRAPAPDAVIDDTRARA